MTIKEPSGQTVVEERAGAQEASAREASEVVRAQSSAPGSGESDVDAAWAGIQLTGDKRRWYVAIGILLAITSFAAIAHGYFGNRWFQRGGLHEVGAVVAEMPRTNLPHWDFNDDLLISDSVTEMLKTAGQVSRTYRYAPHGEHIPGAPKDLLINVAVFVGEPGRITAHDPQVCYSADDYKGIGTRRRIEFDDAEGYHHEFWTMQVSKSSMGGAPPLIVSHAWGSDGSCTAADYPRLTYLGQPYLYKVQLAMISGPSNDKLDDNMSIRFLKEFLPELRRTIQSAQR